VIIISFRAVGYIYIYIYTMYDTMYLFTSIIGDFTCRKSWVATLKIRTSLVKRTYTCTYVNLKSDFRLTIYDHFSETVAWWSILEYYQMSYTTCCIYDTMSEARWSLYETISEVRWSFNEILGEIGLSPWHHD
jgi:hypothetical protein